MTRKSEMARYIEHLEAENARLKADYDQMKASLEESQGMYQSLVLPTLSRAQEANREYVQHLRHCPDPDAGRDT